MSTDVRQEKDRSGFLSKSQILVDQNDLHPSLGKRLLGNGPRITDAVRAIAIFTVGGLNARRFLV